MNITTHGKDGTRIRFMEAEKRRWQQTLADLDTISNTRYTHRDKAGDAWVALAKFLIAEELLDEKQLGEPADQHREENTEEHEQKLSGAGKR